MDVLGAVEGLRALKFSCRVTLYNANTYLTDAISKGSAQRWRSNGWKNSERQPTPYADLWEALLELCTKHEGTFQWLAYDSKNFEYANCRGPYRTARPIQTT